jgi:hypothetical protein
MTRATKRWMMAGSILCGVLALAGCEKQTSHAAPAPPRPELKQAPPTPIAEKKDELGEQSWNPQWDEIVEKALSPKMLSPRMARGAFVPDLP